MQNKKSRTVVIATGGSGGHIFPALHVAEVLQARGCQVVFAGTFGTGAVRVTSRGFPVYEFKSKGLTGQSLKNFLFAAGQMTCAIVAATQALKKIQPDAVAGFGSYGAFAVVFAALILRIPVLIHEQNVCPGRANSLLARGAKKIAISFEQSRKYFPHGRVVLTGCPAKEIFPPDSRADLLQRFGLKETVPIILVLGGSQGSRRVNAVFVETALVLRKECEFQVIHVAGKDDVEMLRQHYRYLRVPHYVCDFMEDIEKAYALASLAISRAGAVSVTELCLFNVPSILIPYPYAGGHQKENARAMVETHGAVMVEEENLSPLRLRDLVRTCLLKGRRLPSSGNGVAHKGAAEKIAVEIQELMGAV